MLSAEKLDEIVEAYCDANMKCDDDTGLYDVRPGCEARKTASRIWLTVTGVGLLIDEVRRQRADLAAGAARIGELEAAMAEAVAIVKHHRDTRGSKIAEQVVRRCERLLEQPVRSEGAGDGD